MENREIASLLAETADLMEIAAEDGFRIRSYRNAATSIEGYPERIADIAANPERKLTDVPGIGKGIAGVICDLLERGTFNKRDELLAKYPPTALELLKIQGLGPKSIAILIEHFRVSTIDDLERLCNEQKLRTLPRMGAKLEEKVLRSIQQYRTSAGRFLLPFAQRTASELIEYLAETPGVEQVTAAGSFASWQGDGGRSGLAGDWPESGPCAGTVRQVCARQRSAGTRREQSERACRPRRHSGGCARASGRKLRRRNAVFHGQQGPQRRAAPTSAADGIYAQRVWTLARLDNNERVAGATEEEIYQALGLHWIPPELRENCGEIEAAEAALTFADSA